MSLMRDSHETIMALLRIFIFLFFSCMALEFDRIPCPTMYCSPDCSTTTADANGCPMCFDCLEAVEPILCKDKICPQGAECREVTFGCENVREGIPCDPVIKAVCEPVCDEVPCPIRCQYGLAHDVNGCQLCRCLPDPCAAVLCLSGTTCVRVSDDGCTDSKCPPFIAVCKSVCREYRCSTHCSSGYLLDKNGCQTCQCKDPCEALKCTSDQICAADSSVPDGKKCATPGDLCCPEPKPPTNETELKNVCQRCFRDCSTIRCGGQNGCCPDYLGCYGCRMAEACRPMV